MTNKIKEIEKKQKEEKELDEYNFTFEDIMLKRDLESIKCLINPLYQSSFEIEWNRLEVGEKQNYLMTRDYEILEEKFKTSKPTITGKEVKIDKETYDTLKEFMNTSKMVIRDMPKNQALFEELNEYTNHYREMKQENRHLEVEIKRLEDKNEKLRKENRRLHNFLNVMLQTIKKFFNKILHLGSEKDKDDVVEEITSYHGLGYYNDRDLHDIADDTPREREINNYIYEQNYGIDKDYDELDIDI